MTTVHIYTENSINASIIKAYLEKNGIDAVLKDEIIGTVAPHLANYGASKAVRVEVKAEDVRQAKELLKEYEQEQETQTDTWVCSPCHTENEPSFDICWQCCSPRT